MCWVIKYKDEFGQLHRDNDFPAIESTTKKEWYISGQLHRENGLPAIEWTNGNKAWYKNGQLYRDNGLPVIERSNGTNQSIVNKYTIQYYHKAGQYGGSDYVKEWYKNGQLHREGGLPAVEYANGYKVWWINGKRLSNERGLMYSTFCQRMQEKTRIKAQKKIYYWWIPICYDIERECGKRMAQKNVYEYQRLMNF